MLLEIRLHARILVFILAIVFALNSFNTYSQGQVSIFSSETFASDVSVLRGIRFDPANPLRLEFILDGKGRSPDEDARLVRYFLAGLATPGKELWVNLSPYESDKIISSALARTELGRDLLSQDYLLKQLAASLTHPEIETGKAYWDAVRRKNNVIDQSFQKVWIVPEKAEVYEQGNSVLITNATLGVMTADDYTALAAAKSGGVAAASDQGKDSAFKKYILPVVRGEVNEGYSFARLRQMYHAMILATWFKKKFAAHVYRGYVDGGNVNGIDLSDPQIKQKLYNLYCEAFKRGSYDYIKKERVSVNRISRRRYFCGGVAWDGLSRMITPVRPVSAGAYWSNGFSGLAVDLGETVASANVDSPAYDVAPSAASPSVSAP